MTEETQVLTPEAKAETHVKNYGYMEEYDDANNDVEEKTNETTASKEQETKPETETKKQADAEPAKLEAKSDEKPADVTTADWKTALKAGVDKYEVLKELGYDDFTIGMLKYGEQTKDYTPYLQVKTVDYTKMTPEQLIKMDLKEKNPGMSEKALEFKFNKEISEKYYLNRDDYPEDSDEAIYGQEQLRLDGEQKRKAFIEEQDKFKAPEPTPDLDATKREAELQQKREALGNSILNNEATKSLQKTNTITFGEGEESFNYPVADPKALVDVALNTIINSGRTDLNGVDLQLFYKQLAKGHPDWEKSFADHLKAIHKNQFQSELQNVTPANGALPEEPETKKDYGYKTR